MSTGNPKGPKPSPAKPAEVIAEAAKTPETAKSAETAATSEPAKPAEAAKPAETVTPAQPPQVSLAAGAPAARAEPSLHQQLRAMEYGEVTVDDFMEICGLQENARSYLDALITRGYVERNWRGSSGVYSLTKDGVVKLNESRAKVTDPV